MCWLWNKNKGVTHNEFHGEDERNVQVYNLGKIMVRKVEKLHMFYKDDWHSNHILGQFFLMFKEF